ncbi:hypothetical protein EJ110_NYTH21094 [Nymphaea thermarum]|nr:hypothetical protein EJ110_NYTH21094 [Nymphaea thermarum]
MRGSVLALYVVRQVESLPAGVWCTVRDERNLCCTNDAYITIMLWCDVVNDVRALVVVGTLIRGDHESWVFSVSFNPLLHAAASMGAPVVIPAEKQTGESSSRKRKSDELGVKVAFKTMSDVENLDDGYRWRKYGKKMVKDNQNPSWKKESFSAAGKISGAYAGRSVQTLLMLDA